MVYYGELYANIKPVKIHQTLILGKLCCTIHAEDWNLLLSSAHYHLPSQRQKHGSCLDCPASLKEAVWRVDSHMGGILFYFIICFSHHLCTLSASIETGTFGETTLWFLLGTVLQAISVHSAHTSILSLFSFLIFYTIYSLGLLLDIP